MSIFPGSTPSFAGFTSSHTLAQDNHAAQHNSEQAEIIALANKIGIGSSTPASSLVLRGTDVGTSAWSPVNLTSDVTGVLPQANGGTGTTLATGTGKAVYDTAPTVSNPTFTGGGSWAGSPSLTTPTIASFTNSTHNHQNAAGGGQLSAPAISSIDLTNTTIKYPYKFNVYLTNAQNIGTGDTLVQFDTKNFDTGSNVDIITNKGRFTAPVAGFYQFNANISTTGGGTGTQVAVSLYKNGLVAVRLSLVSASAGSIPSPGGSTLLQLAANDYIEVYGGTVTAAKLLDTGNAGLNTFSGYQVSNT